MKTLIDDIYDFDQVVTNEPPTNPQRDARWAISHHTKAQHQDKEPTKQQIRTKTLILHCDRSLLKDL